MSFTAVESPQRSRWWPRIQRSPRRDADLLGRLDRSLVIDDAGFDVVLTKPCVPSFLVEEIRRLLAT